MMARSGETRTRALPSPVPRPRGTSYAVVITNNADGTIRGNSSTVAVIDGSATVGGSVSPIASTNNETVINYGIIQQDGTGKAISLGSGSNSVQILGGAASINGDISGGTSAGSNTLLIDPNLVTTNSPTTGQSFSYSHSLSNFNSVSLSSGTITLSGANTYTGNTAVTGGTTYINNTSGSGTGTGDVAVSANAKLGGFGIIQPGSGNGVSPFHQQHTDFRWRPSGRKSDDTGRQRPDARQYQNLSNDAKHHSGCKCR